MVKFIYFFRFEKLELRIQPFESIQQFFHSKIPTKTSVLKKKCFFFNTSTKNQINNYRARECYKPDFDCLTECKMLQISFTSRSNFQSVNFSQECEASS